MKIEGRRGKDYSTSPTPPPTPTPSHSPQSPSQSSFSVALSRGSWLLCKHCGRKRRGKEGDFFFPIPFFSIAEFSASLPFPWANRVVPNCNLFEPSGGRDKKAAGRRLAYRTVAHSTHWIPFSGYSAKILAACFPSMTSLQPTRHSGKGGAFKNRPPPSPRHTVRWLRSA